MRSFFSLGLTLARTASQRSFAFAVLSPTRWTVTPLTGGGSDHNLLNDAYFISLLKLIQSGHYRAIFAAPPCSTYSVSRFFKAPAGTQSAPPTVSRAEKFGVNTVLPVVKSDSSDHDDDECSGCRERDGGVH